MSRILCLSAPLASHLDWGGYLATALALRARGHEVLWASGEGVAGQIQANQLPFHLLTETGWSWPLPAPLQRTPELSDEAWQQLRMKRALDQWLDVERVGQATEAILALAKTWQPEVILSEMFIGAAGMAAEVLQIPLVVAGWPAHMPPQKTEPTEQQASDSPVLAPILEGRRRLQDLFTRFQIAGQNWTTSGPPALRSPHLHISYWSERWFGEQRLEEQTKHVGGMAAPSQPADTSLPSPEDRPWVLLTLGTTLGNDANFYIMAAEATVRLGCIPILALGNQFSDAQQSALQQHLPDWAIVRERILFPAVLPSLAAAIHHGGAGTTHALVTHAVPQLIVPHAADQQRQAHGAVRSGVGLAIAAKDVTVDRLERMVATILPDLSPQRQAAQQLQAEFAALGGVQRAAELVESIVFLNEM